MPLHARATKSCSNDYSGPHSRRVWVSDGVSTFPLPQPPDVHHCPLSYQDELHANAPCHSGLCWRVRHVKWLKDCLVDIGPTLRIWFPYLSCPTQFQVLSPHKDAGILKGGCSVCLVNCCSKHFHDFARPEWTQDLHFLHQPVP